MLSIIKLSALLLALAGSLSFAQLASWPSEHLNAQNHRAVPFTFNKVTGVELYDLNVKATSVYGSVLSDGKLLFLGTACFHKDQHNVYLAFDPAAKKIVWRREMVDTTMTSGILIGNALVFITNSRLLILDKNTGKTTFEQPIAMEQKGRYPAPTRIGDDLLFADSKGMLYRFNIAKRALVWQADLKDELSGAPLVVGDEIIASRKFGIIMRLNANTGALLGQFGTSPILSAPYISSGILFTAEAPAHLAARKMPDGQRFWIRALVEGMTNTPVSDGKDLVFAATPGYSVHAINFDAGTTRWTTYEKSSVNTYLSSPTMMKNALAVVGFTDNFYLLDPATGAELAAVKHGGIAVNSPTVLPGLIAFATSIFRNDPKSGDRYSFANLVLVRYE